MTSLLQSVPETLPPKQIVGSHHVTDWLRAEQISLACTTYQTSRLLLMGVNAAGGLAGFERIFDRAMGLYATSEHLYLSTKYQLWQLDNALEPGQQYQGHDRLYIPRIGHTTGDLDIHDVVAIPGEGGREQVIFACTALNCLAMLSDRHSCQPIWLPPFISKLTNEDRCHLNGLAVVENIPRYVTAVSQSDIVDGWRDRRRGGGVVMDIVTNEIVATGLSMPHSPRWYRNKLWLLNSGRGDLGTVNLATGQFEALTFCPGYLRGLAFWKDWAIVGLSKSRQEDHTFGGLELDELLIERDAELRCGLMMINLNTGNIDHWLRLEGGAVTELYDVQVLPGTQHPMVLGFQTEEIAQLITLAPSSNLMFASSASSQSSQVTSSQSSQSSQSLQSLQSSQITAPQAPKQVLGGMTNIEYWAKKMTLNLFDRVASPSSPDHPEAIAYFEQSRALQGVETAGKSYRSGTMLAIGDWVAAQPLGGLQ